MLIKTVIELNRSLNDCSIEQQLEEVKAILAKESSFHCEKVEVENGLVTVFNNFSGTEEEVADEELSIIAELSPLFPENTYFWTKTNDEQESVILSDNYDIRTNQNI